MFTANCRLSDNVVKHNGTIGVPVPNTDIKIIKDDGSEAQLGEAGELWVKGEQVMRGYWQRPEATAEVLQDGWMATGDIVIMDESYSLRIVDRKKDMILVSGFNVYPNEIEDVVMLNYKVAEVVAIGVPHEVSGETIKIFVVKKDDSLTLMNYANIADNISRVIKSRKILSFAMNYRKVM